jgi:1,4-dihydroxy-2-naphthoate octaprenyltransferase
VTEAGRRRLARALAGASRPAQLLLIAGVYLLGVKIAAAKGTVVAVEAVAAGGLALLPVAASIHWANEYADYETDARTERTPFSGGSGALQAAGLGREVALYAGAAALGLGAVLAALLAATGRLRLPAAGLLAVIAVFGWQYSVGPLRLAWRGLGELDNALLGGLVLPVYGAAAVGGPLRSVALASVPFLLVVFLNLLATQWPDRRADAAVGKDTLVSRLSPGLLRRLYVAVALAAAVSLALLWPAVLPTPVATASLAAAPLVVWGAAGYTERRLPLPSVAAMVVLALAQLAGWCLVAHSGA